MTAEEIIERMDRQYLTRSENETTLSITADDRDTWRAFTNDPVWVREFVKKGATLVEATVYGAAFNLRAEQLSFRKPISEKRREQLRKQGREAVSNLLESPGS